MRSPTKATMAVALLATLALASATGAERYSAAARGVANAVRASHPARRSARRALLQHVCAMRRAHRVRVRCWQPLQRLTCCTRDAPTPPPHARTSPLRRRAAPPT